ncbi:uncharacterized protein A4U43_C03F31830 [Asparagus officinalis]|uniref:Uncharacterized protein n=1 Tax=Asparagus officinalis TaxID=4686 RepID=A0A5P1FEG8_ASPOF|nr:uncharacterized protein A4U43_C03F31830 [Asparagus officinalis]
MQDPISSRQLSRAAQELTNTLINAGSDIEPPALACSSRTRPVISVHAVKSLRESKQQQDDGSDQGYNSPGIPEVVVLQACSPRVPPVVVVPVHLLGQAREVAVVHVEHHLLTHPVEELRDLPSSSLPSQCSMIPW